jgi:hypothetical protein
MGDEQPTLNIRLGWADVAAYASVKTHRAMGMSEDKATIDVPVEALRLPGVSFAGEVQITATYNGRVHPMFTGLVDTADLDDKGVARIELTGLHRDLETSLIGGLVVGEGTGKVEMIYSLLRQAGLPEARMDLGWTPGPRETFIVAAPVPALALTKRRQVSDVAFTDVIPVTMNLSGDRLVAEFEQASCWASTTVEALTLNEAEGGGIVKLSAALDEVRAFACYSYPVLDGAVRSFKWQRTRARPELSSLTYVGAVASPRRWLRDRVDPSKLETLDLDDLPLPTTTELGVKLPTKRQLGRALAEWHLSVDASTEAARLAHLWRAMECYAAGVNMAAVESPSLFSKDELTAAGDALRSAQTWSTLQAARIEDLVGGLNNPPILTKIRAALKADQIEVVEAEFDSLAATRSMRNGLEHGRSLTGAQYRALDLAVAVANRIIVEAVVNRRRPAPGSDQLTISADDA